MPHIVLVPENTQGKTLVMGDIHGNLELFNHILADLKDGDQLFIAGDLLDRGEHGFDIIKRIIQINKEAIRKGNPEQIYVVRGNHEEVHLQRCKYLRDGDSLTELEQKRAQQLMKYEDYQDASIDEITISSADLFNREMELLEKFLESLPYIIYVDGKNPFALVHSELPMTGIKLREKIDEFKKQQPKDTMPEKIPSKASSPSTSSTSISHSLLSASSKHKEAKYSLELKPEQIKHLLFSRKRTKDLPVKKESSLYPFPIFCGHRIGEGYRSENSHYNLDSGAYAIDTTHVVNVTEKRCDLFTLHSDLETINKQIEKATFMKFDPILHAWEMTLHLSQSQPQEVYVRTLQSTITVPIESIFTVKTYKRAIDSDQFIEQPSESTETAGFKKSKKNG